MKNIRLILIITFVLASCNSTKNQTSQTSENKEVYKSEKLIITKLSENVYEHTSFLETRSFGRVPCNGMIIKDGSETVVLDTPVNDSSSAKLILWIKNDLKSNIKAVIPTHYHDDNLGGLNEFHKQNIPSYAYKRTIELAREHNLAIPQNSFDSSLVISVGRKKVIAEFLGEGHTCDNIIGYFPSENIMFGGCLIKEEGGTKGNLQEANVEEWSKSVKRLKEKYPNTRIVVPGHGRTGGIGLLDYTIKLFE